MPLASVFPQIRGREQVARRVDKPMRLGFVLTDVAVALPLVLAVGSVAAWTLVAVRVKKRLRELQAGGGLPCDGRWEWNVGVSLGAVEAQDWRKARVCMLGEWQVVGFVQIVLAEKEPEGLGGIVLRFYSREGVRDLVASAGLSQTTSP
jgi:hypothetical protein